MSAATDKLLDDIVALALIDHPLPVDPGNLSPHSRAHLERQAQHARMTPEALWALSRSRDRLTREERRRALARDMRNLGEGRAMDDDDDKAATA